MAIAPTKEQIQALLDSDLDAPVVMLNLLKFAERSGSDDGNEGGCRGASRTAVRRRRALDAREGRAGGSCGRGGPTRS